MPAPTATTNALALLDEVLNVDIDSVEPSVAQRVTQALGHKPHDQTSNPIVVQWAFEDPKYKEDALDSIRQRYKSDGWEGAYDHFIVKLCARNKPNFSGRVLIQLSGRHVNSTAATLVQARRIAREFELLGLTRDEFAVKIPVSGPNTVAMAELNKEGIRTLGTLIVCVAQGIAASQSDCLYISPYYNESAAHVNPEKFWPNVEDPALQHPMSPRVIQIVEIYKQLYKKTGRQQPLLKLAGFIGYKEALGAVELGAQSTTMLPRTLDELAALPGSSLEAPIRGQPKVADADFYKNKPLSQRLEKWAKTDPLANEDWDGQLPSPDTDYIADNGKAVDDAIKADKTANARWTFSCNRHVAADMASLAVINRLLPEAFPEGFLVWGYDSGVVNAFQQNPQFFEQFPSLATDPVLLGAVLGFFVLGNCLGGLATIAIGNRIGRRDIIAIGAVGSLLGAGLQTGAVNLPMLIASRLVNGVFSGMAVTITPTYVAEIASTRYRSMLLNSTLLSAAAGLSVAYWICYAFATDLSARGWRLPSGITCALIFASMLFIVFSPESPRYLVEVGQEDKALHVLHRLFRSEDMAQTTLNDIKIAYALEHTAQAKGMAVAFAANSQCFRYRTLLIMGVYIAVQGSGVALSTYYAGNVFKGVGLEGRALSITLGGLGLSGLVGTVVGVFVVIEYCGRVRTLMAGSFVCGVCMIFICVSAAKIQESWAPYLGAFGLMTYFFAFSMSFNPLAWSLAPEITPLAIRPQVCAIGQATLAAVNFVIIMASPRGFEKIGYKMYYPFILVNFLFIPAIWYFCPETGRLPLEHIDRLVVNGKVYMRRSLHEPAREVHFECMGSVSLDGKHVDEKIEVVEGPSSVV